MPASEVKKSQAKRRGGGDTTATKRKRSGRVELPPDVPLPRKKKKTAAQAEAELHQRAHEAREAARELVETSATRADLEFLWPTCERCAVHFDEGAYSCHIRSAGASFPQLVVLTLPGQSCVLGDLNPLTRRRCFRCHGGHGECTPLDQREFIPRVNAISRAYDALQQSMRNGDSADTINALNAHFEALNAKWKRDLSAFQSSRRKRVGVMATPKCRAGIGKGGSGGGSASAMDVAGVEEAQRIRCALESLVDLGSFVWIPHLPLCLRSVC